MTFVPSLASATCLLAFTNPPNFQINQPRSAPLRNNNKLPRSPNAFNFGVTTIPPRTPQTKFFATEIEVDTPPAPIPASSTDTPDTSDTTLTSDAQTRYNDLLKWLTSTDKRAYISPKFEIRPSTRGGLATGGYGAFASDNLTQGELLLRIPRPSCITLDDALNDNECGASFKNLMEKAGPGSDTVILAGYLAKEYLLLKEYDRRLEGGASAEDDSEMRRLSKIKFGPYLRTLPWERFRNAQEHVLFWSNEEVDSLLKGSLAYEDAVEIRSTVTYATKILNGIIGPVIRKARGDDQNEDDEEGFRLPWQPKPEKKSSDEILDGLEEAVRGAFVICLSRSFAVSVTGDESKEEERLEPVLDMLQHSNNPNIKHKNTDDGSIEVTMGVDVQAGEELFNQYRGEEDENMPYHKFFTRFGFVPGVVEPLADLIAARSTIFFPQRASV